MPDCYYRYGTYLHQRFGATVRKVSVDAGFTCPNRDGSKGRGGCAYCNNDAFSPPRFLKIRNVGMAAPGRTRTGEATVATGQELPGAPGDSRNRASRLKPASEIAQQLREGIVRSARRYPAAKFLAYFQPFSNTYAAPEQLREVYESALSVPEVIGICIGTRADCVSAEILDLLEELAGRAYVQLELGLQTANNETLRRLNCRSTVEEFQDVMFRSRDRGFDLCGHLIVGLPGEDRSAALRTATVMVAAGITGIKIHNLHLVRGAGLERQQQDQPLPRLTLPEYASIVADLLERLPESVTVQRLYGNAPREWLIAPAWCLEGGRVIRTIEAELRRRNTRQGFRISPRAD